MAKIETHYYGSREEWEMSRRGTIGASEVGAIIGVSPFMTPWQVWDSHVSGVTTPETTAMKMGHMLEPIVAQLYSESCGDEMVASSVGDFRVTNEQYPFASVSPDRYFIDDNGEEYLLECKTTALRFSEDNFPKSWYCQVQYQLAVTGKKIGVVAWLSQGREFSFKKFERNDEFIEWLMPKVAEFAKMVAEGIPPEMDPTDADAAFGKVTAAGAVAATTDDLALVDRYRVLREKIKTAEKELEDIACRIKLRIGEAESLEVDGKALVAWRTRKGSKTIDSKKLKEVNPELYYECLREGAPTRTFKVL